MRARRRLFALAFSCALTLWGVPVFADARADIEKARAAYLAHNYKESEDRLRALLDPKTGIKEPGLISQARMYLGATLMAGGHREQAASIFEKLILEDPTFEPDPLGFPGDVINAFIDERARLQERLRTAAQNAARLEAERKVREEAQRIARERWLAQVKAMAQEDKVVVRNNRLTAFVPFGVGQFQNGDKTLGWVFLGSEAALATASVITLPMYYYARQRAAEESETHDVEQKQQLYEDRANAIQLVNFGLVGAFAIVAVAGVVQANVSFVGERVELKKRELPPEAKTPPPRFTPVIAPLTGGSGVAGGYVGMSGVLF